MGRAGEHRSAEGREHQQHEGLLRASGAGAQIGRRERDHGEGGEHQQAGDHEREAVDHQQVAAACRSGGRRHRQGGEAHAETEGNDRHHSVRAPPHRDRQHRRERGREQREPRQERDPQLGRCHHPQPPTTESTWWSTGATPARSGIGYRPSHTRTAPIMATSATSRVSRSAIGSSPRGSPWKTFWISHRE